MMWTVLNNIGQLLGLRTHEPTVDLNSIAAILDDEDAISIGEEDELSSETNVNDRGIGVICQQRTGVIAGLHENHGFIQPHSLENPNTKLLFFKREDAPNNIKVGNIVEYLTFKVSEDSEWIVRKILSVVDEYWDKNTDDAGEEVVNRLPTELPTFEKKECSVAYKNVIAKVNSRQERTVFASPLQFCLDSVKSDFIPIEGDWLLIKTIAHPGEKEDLVLQVNTIQPVRTRQCKGKVTHWNEPGHKGIVNNEILITQDCCEPGYLPKQGDEVRLTCIESDQGQLTWRAVTVMSLATIKDHTTSLDLGELLKNKQGIVLSEDTSCGTINKGQSSSVQISVKNESEDAHKLISVELLSGDVSQIELIEPSLNEPMTLNPQKTKFFNLVVRARFIGRSTELVVFKFQGFDIGRQVALNVEDASAMYLMTPKHKLLSSRKPQEPISAEKLLATRNGFVVPGVRTIKPPSFIPVHLGSFVVPEKLINLVVGSGRRRKDEVIADLLGTYASLADPLNEQNYILRWDTVLFLEEVENMVNISRYNTESALHQVYDYISLKIPGLCERRPSLIPGDKVIAREPWGSNNIWVNKNEDSSVKYEGYIHKVLSDEVLLKFNSNFHGSLTGIYSLSFEANRTGFRREHQAVHIAFRNLTANWLFPSCLDYKPPQITISKEENSVNDRSKENESISSESKTSEVIRPFDSYESSPKENNKIENLNDSNQIDVPQNDCSKSLVVNDYNSSEKTKSTQQLQDVVKTPNNNSTNNTAGKPPRKFTPPRRVPVADRFLQSSKTNGVTQSTEGGVQSMLQQLANLSPRGKLPIDNNGFKTLEEIEKSILNKTNSDDILTGITRLSHSQDNEDTQTQSHENHQNCNNRLNQSACRENKINWNSTIEMKLGNEKTAYVKNSRNKNNKCTLKWLNPDLNRHQKEAVRNILLGEARPLPYIIFGPPGTGKTITLVEAILQTYLLIPDCRILIGTPSNSAADLVCQRLLASGVLEIGDLFRLVSYNYAEQGRVPDWLQPYCGTADLKDNSSFQGLLDGDGVPKASRQTIGRHRITVGTCGSLGILYQMGFPRGHFTHVMVDEAGQATEPEILIPIAFLDTTNGHTVLAGDPLQLGPIVLSKIAEHFGLGESLLCRMLQRTPYSRDVTGFPTTGGYNPRLITKLRFNYRSLPQILSLPNDMFYNGDLIPQVSEENSEEAKLLASLRPVLPAKPDGKPPALVFHGVRGTNCQSVDSPSWYNPHEALQTVNYLQAFYAAGLTPDQCGIITPYQAQAMKIRHMLDDLAIEMPKVGSVEEFQGQERMAIILSTVRSSPRLIETDVRHTVGFVASPRRLNVALTRARAVLIIVGNPHLLARDQYWRAVLSHCVHHGSYTGCDRPQFQPNQS